MTDPIDIGSRWELFVDEFLIEHMEGTHLALQKPQLANIALELDAPWEDDVAAFRSVVNDNGTIRLYYRASIPDRSNEAGTVNALAESNDGGITFTRPNLGLVEFNGSKENNILYTGELPFTPPPAFIDTNPDCKPEQRYKGLAAHWKQLYAMASPDGIHWQPMSEEKIRMEGTFDTINTAFWDARSECYRCFTRYFENLEENAVEANVLGPEPTVIRAIQSSTSRDFINWTPVIHHEYDDDYDDMQLYTNATIPCPGAEHIYLAFPNRYSQKRTLYPDHEIPGCNDALFMASRDCIHWKRYAEAWVRPGLDQLNWTDRNNYPTWGLIETSPTEWSAYISRNYRHPGTPVKLQRLAIRPHGFVSAHADFSGGEFVTKPVIFSGHELHLNYSTSSAGSIRIELQDENGLPIPGYAMEDMELLYGDKLDGTAAWKQNSDLSELAGRPIRLRFALQDADIFGFKFSNKRK